MTLDLQVYCSTHKFRIDDFRSETLFFGATFFQYLKQASILSGILMNSLRAKISGLFNEKNNHFFAFLLLTGRTIKELHY